MFNSYLGNNRLVGKCRWGLSRAGVRVPIAVTFAMIGEGQRN